ncbi:MAG: hypothetical protein ACOYL3_23780 [Desulfuromonadaceae bacterium]
MKYLTINKRFLLVAIVGLIVPVAVLTIGLWREACWNDNSFTSDENSKRLDLAVRSLRRTPGGNWKPDHINTQGITVLAGNDRLRRERIVTAIGSLDKKLGALTGERIHGDYYLDLDALALEVKGAKGLYGSPYEIALSSLRSLRSGNTLSLLTWLEDLPVNKRNSSAYWNLHVAKMPDSLLVQKNPWGPCTGAILVENSPNSGKATRSLFKVSGQDVTYSDGKNYVDVTQSYPDFKIPSLNSVISHDLGGFLEYGKGLVDKGNMVTINGKSVVSGYDVILTFDPVLQISAMKLVEAQLEGGSVTTATLLAMDVNSGEILAAASAEEAGAKKKGGLPLIFQEVAAASTSKLIFGAAMLENANYFLKHSNPKAQKLLAALPEALKSSDTDFFEAVALDFGAANLFRDQASKFGWNQDCTPDGACVGGIMDYLFGSVNKSSSSYPLAGRLFVRPDRNNTFQLLTDTDLAGLPTYKSLLYSLKSGIRPANTTSTSFDTAKRVKVTMTGQGDVRTSPWGELQTVSHIASAANGSKVVLPPHLVRQVLNAHGIAVPIPQVTAIPVGMQVENGQRLAAYLSAVNAKGGTAGEVFKDVFGRYAVPNEKIFAKTGTTDDECSIPYKLYVSSYSRNGKEYDTALIAITERKLVNGAYSPKNMAADLALRFVRQSMITNTGEKR